MRASESTRTRSRSRATTADTSSIVCEDCGAPTKYGYRQCWRCHVEELEKAAWAEGFDAGLAAGIAKAQREAAAHEPDLMMLRRLVQLCHPDRHAGSEAAKTATQWLVAEMDRAKRRDSK